MIRYSRIGTGTRIGTWIGTWTWTWIWMNGCAGIVGRGRRVGDDWDNRDDGIFRIDR
jgi:hypothetical protein